MQSQHVFNVSRGDLFDSVAYTNGGLPHLMQYLWDQYCEYLQEESDLRKAEGRVVSDLAMAKKKAPATHFAKWAADFLKQNRVVESFFIDENHGIRLSDNTRVAVCPGIEIRGTMQRSTAVEITSGLSQPSQRADMRDESIRL